jgi:hypothetical protein
MRWSWSVSFYVPKYGKNSAMISSGLREAEFGQNVVHVLFDGTSRDNECLGDATVGFALRHQAKNFGLARSERGEQILGSASAKDLGNDFWVESRPAVCNSMQGFDEVGDVGDTIFQEIPDAPVVTYRQ